MTDSTTSKKILIVEDEQFISELYLRALIRAGYEAEVQYDGRKAFEMAKSDTYDIILLDLMVPNMTGMEILRELRDNPDAPKLHSKIIVATNLEERAEKRAAIEQNADGYLIKANITPKELVEFLDSVG